MVEHRFARVPDLREAGDIPGSIELSRGEVAPTYIPMKNAIFYSLAAAYAEEKGARYVIGGHNGDDKMLFDDTSEDFFAGLEKTLLAGSRRLRRNNLSIQRPLKDMPKAEVIALAARVEVPFELTWSCHRTGAAHCWKCDGCKRRREAFAEAGVSDPLFSKKV